MVDWVTVITAIVVAGFLAYTMLFPSRKAVHDNSVIAITGGSAGIGLAYAEAVVRNHTPKRVILLARNAETLHAARTRVLAARKFVGTQVDVMTCDVSNHAECETVARTLGEVDVLVNCAGLSHPTELENLQVSEIQSMVNTNLLGSIFLTRAIIPGMKKRRAGVVVFVGSQASQCGLYGYSVYSATKFAIRGLAEALQMELKPFGVAVCVSYPPDTNTEAYIRENKTKPEATRLMSEGGLMEPEQVADSMRKGIEKRHFTIWSNFDGFMLSQLTCGFSPANNFFHLAYQIPLMGIMRLVAACYLSYFNAIASKCVKKNGVKKIE